MGPKHSIRIGDSRVLQEPALTKSAALQPSLNTAYPVFSLSTRELGLQIDESRPVSLSHQGTSLAGYFLDDRWA